MNKTTVLFVALSVIGATYAHAEKAPIFGEIAGLVSAEKIYTSMSHNNNLKQKQREWIRLFVNRGDQVRKGQKIAEHRNRKGKVVLEYIANRSGRILLNSRSAVDSVESILEIITVGEEKYCEYENCGLIGVR
ncbi:hypothetical protein [Microbulbifer sp. JMSA003]|uniref:hypothetical protein n=1 Tax=Microbulbifer sp. JMSA003 TaxID=3243369 RepID=UPI00403A35CF